MSEGFLFWASNKVFYSAFLFTSIARHFGLCVLLFIEKSKLQLWGGEDLVYVCRFCSQILNRINVSSIMSLSNGALVKILNGQTPENPVFQLINARKIGSTTNSGVDRYRLIVSDGDYMYSHVMLPAQHNHLIESGDMENLAIIKVNKYLCNVVNGDRKVLILVDVTVMDKGSERIGDPAHLNPGQIPSLSETKAEPPSNANQSSEPNGKVLTSANNNNKSVAPTTPKLNKMGSTSGTPGGSRIHPIASLTPYQNRWRIRVRVTNKGNIRTWNNSRGEGRLFSVNLLDESGEIKCTGFNEQVDKFYNMLEVNKVYFFSKCTLKTANKQYNTTNCDYEMTMNAETLIEPCDDNDDELPTVTFDFIPISKLQDCKANSNVDILAVVKTFKDLGTVISRATQKELQKRDIQVVDQSGVAVSLTLWGDDAVKFDGAGFPILALKGARVSEFGGRSLSVGGGTTMIINPDTKEAHVLRGWFDEEGRNQTFDSFQSEGGAGSQSSNWKTFLQAKTENLGQGDKPDYFTAKGTVVFLKRDNCLYQACPSADCKKKVVDLGNGLYRCEKCAREFPNFKYNMILSANIADFSDNQWISCFKESAEVMVGLTADELGALRQDDEIGFDNVMQEALFKSYIFRLRTKMDTYNDESRLKTVCMAATPIDWVNYGNHLVEELGKLGV